MMRVVVDVENARPEFLANPRDRRPEITVDAETRGAAAMGVMQATGNRERSVDLPVHHQLGRP
jgi:hypothetical protein